MIEKFLNLTQIAEHLAQAFPDAQPVGPLRLLGAGFGSLAVQTPGGLVFRIALTEQAGRQYERERALLPLFAPYLPVAVPQPRWYSPGGSGFPFGAIGYPRLPGSPPEPEALDEAGRAATAEQLAQIIAGFHSIPLEGLPVRDSFGARLAKWKDEWQAAEQVLQSALEPGEYRAVSRWVADALADADLRAYAPTAQHGDLWFGNLLADGTRITGLIDFQEAGVGDPAQDFVPQLYLGERFLRQVLAAFERAGGVLDGGFFHRLERLWGLREFSGLACAVRAGDRAELADALEKIRRGPILSPHGLDGWGLPG